MKDNMSDIMIKALSMLTELSSEDEYTSDSSIEEEPVSDMSSSDDEVDDLTAEYKCLSFKSDNFASTCPIFSTNFSQPKKRTTTSSKRSYGITLISDVIPDTISNSEPIPVVGLSCDKLTVVDAPKVTLSCDEPNSVVVISGNEINTLLGDPTAGSSPSPTVVIGNNGTTLLNSPPETTTEKREDRIEKYKKAILLTEFKDYADSYSVAIVDMEDGKKFLPGQVEDINRILRAIGTK